MLALAACGSALALSAGFVSPGATPRAAGQTGAQEVAPQTDDSMPAREVIMMGASPGESADETWGIGRIGPLNETCWAVVRYTSEGGWSLAPGPLNAAGQPLAGFEPDQPESGGEQFVTPLAGQMTVAGSGVLLGSANAEGECKGGGQQVLLVRSPGHPFQETNPEPEPEEGEGALLKTGESLFGSGRTPLLAPLDEAGGVAGALVVPIKEASEGVEEAVLYWDGRYHTWTREQIEVPETSRLLGGFRVLAIGASSPSNAWLLGQLSSASNEVALFRRHVPAEGAASWVPVAPAPGEALGAPLKADGEIFTVARTGEPPKILAQILTVTSEGVWIDGERPDVKGTMTMFFKPKLKEDERVGGEVHTWCNAPAGAPPCDHPLPEPLPSGPSRSFAWEDAANPDGFGQRVITGLGEGVSLRLEGATFKRVLALGGSEPPNDVGGTTGAAFSSPREGWLGNERLPVHLTLNPLPSRLTPYPVPFKHPLTAIAPQPEAPVGALSSQALAVGDDGEVARFTPGEGWQPESLFGPGGRVQRPPLRAVAWPSPTRAYAVGVLDKRGDSAMWLWRGETGLWEPDPAMPLNFRGDLLGIAFDPNNPSGGYAVGQQGALLRYGKTWAQEALPPEVAGASFTSIAFAGSEAIVAYRQAHLVDGQAHYTGGLLVNSGSGWHVDQRAAAALGGDVPWAVAGLPDGGASLSAEDASESVPLIFERNAAGAGWQPAPAPYPGERRRPARSRCSAKAARCAWSRPGASRTRARPTAFAAAGRLSPEPDRALSARDRLRPAPDRHGWSDEEHELNEAQRTPGNYFNTTPSISRTRALRC